MPDQQYIIPQTNGPIFITDGGLETTLIYQEGIDLPAFAAFVLLESAQGRETLRHYYQRYTDIASRTGCGFIFDSPTWRANPDWGEKLGYNASALDTANRRAIHLMQELKASMGEGAGPCVINGSIGPRDDGYVTGKKMDAGAASEYHDAQIASFKAAGADMVTGLTMTYPEEAIGIACAARAREITCVISFTTETNGCLPDGTGLREAIETVDKASGSGPQYYMINCAHPDHFKDALNAGEEWLRRIGGIRANASRMSHEELDRAEELDAGDPQELGQLYGELQAAFPWLCVLGGCCGTDHRHIDHMQAACR